MMLIDEYIRERVIPFTQWGVAQRSEESPLCLVGGTRGIPRRRLLGMTGGE